MPTDDDRREVARRLREMGLNPWDDAACEIAQCVGIACCNSECHGSNETPECAMALCARLADLIEPSRDRDALMALADEMQFEREFGSTDYESVSKLCSQMDNCARRIREALGVQDA